MVATFRIDPNRSKVWIEARSSMHPIQGEADGLEGSIEAELADGRIDVSGVPRIQIKLPVDKLQSGKKLEDAFQQIQDELRTQYLASYTPTNPKADGTYRKINLNCGKALRVQTRKGYYAIASTDTQ